MTLAKTRGAYKWATFGRTESGDCLGITLWDHHPEAKEVDEYYAKILPEEYSEVGFVNWRVEEITYAP